MTEVQLYFQLGLEHILDKNAYDHLIFIIALCSPYQPKDWKRVLILVTSFTVGHSITLAMASSSTGQRLGSAGTSITAQLSASTAI